jgi:hypothetical protein
MPDPSTIVALDDYGTAVETSQEDAAARGMRIASPEQAEAYRRDQQYGGVVGTGTALVTGGLRGATLGLSDVVISELGGQETLAGVRDANPLASITGEVAGGLAGLGKGGGALGAISAPARLVTRTGQAVEGAVTGSRILGAVTRAAVEGGIYGTGMAISESALQNKELTAEMLGSHALQGAVLGGSIAGGFGLIGKGAATVADRVRQKVTGGGVGRMMEAAGGSRLVGAWDSAATYLGAPEGAVKSMLTRGKSGKLGVEVALGADDILERSADEITEQLRGVLSTKAKLEQRFKGALKEDQVARLVKRGSETEVRATSDMVLDTLRRELDDMVAREVEFGSQGALKKLRKKVDQAAKKIAAAGDDAVPQRAFMQLDELKRDVGKITRKARGKVDRGGLSEDMATFQRLEQTYEGLRGHLELDRIWGQAGTLQRRINAPWAESIATNREFHRAFSTPTQGKWGARGNEASRDKVAAFVKSMTNPNKSDSMRALTAQLDTLEEFARVADDVMHLPPAERAAVRELSDQVAAMRGKLDDGAEAIAKRNQFKALEESGRSSAGVATTVGALLGGAPGAMMGKALEVVTNPAKTIRQLAAMHSLMAKVETRQAKALASMASSSVPKVAFGGGRLATRALMSPATGQRFEELRQQTEQAQRDPEGMRAQLFAGMGDLPMGAPETAARAADQALEASMYLGQQLPPGATPSPPEMKRWLEIADALGDPTSVLEDAGRGKVRTHQIRAIADVYPEIFSQMRMDVADQLAELEADGRQLPYAQRTSLGIAFGLDTDPMLRFMPAMQAGYAAPPPEPAPPPPPAASSGPAPQIADSLMTGPERRASEG